MKTILFPLLLILVLKLTGCSLGDGGGNVAVRTPTNSGNSGSNSSGLGSDSGSSGGNSLGTDDQSSSDGSSNSNGSSEETSAFNLVNEYRASKGLSVLTWDNNIASVCRTHSSNMANGSVAFGHDGFEARGNSLKASVGWSSIGENVAMNNGFADPAQQAVTGWINSPGHEANMSGNWTKTGMGVAISDDGSYYFTQIFIR